MDLLIISEHDCKSLSTKNEGVRLSSKECKRVTVLWLKKSHRNIYEGRVSALSKFHFHFVPVLKYGFSSISTFPLK